MTSTNRTALVLGATGGMGGAVFAALARHRWMVKALVRDPAKAVARAPGRQPTWIDAPGCLDGPAAVLDPQAA